MRVKHFLNKGVGPSTSPSSAPLRLKENLKDALIKRLYLLIRFIFVVELHLTQLKVWKVTKKIRNKTIEDFKYVTKCTLPIANYKNKI